MTGPFPVENATVPYWRTQLHYLDSHRSTPELPEKQDIVIIGAGFAGAAIAYYLLKDCPETEPKPSITILEAREACSGATGRNGGHIRPDLFVGLAACMQTHGLEAANEAALFEVANAQALEALVRGENIDCDLRAVTTADVFVDAAEAAKIKKLWDAMTKLDCPTLRSVTAYLKPADAERASGIKGAKVAFAYPAHVAWPYKLVMHLLEEVVVKRGAANLQTKTMVHGVSETADGEGYWAVETARGSTRARTVVYATNAYTAGLRPEYDDAIYAARGTVCRVVVPEGTGAANNNDDIPLGSAGLEMESPNLVDSYYGLRPDGSIVAGGAKSAFIDDREEWYRNYDDSTLIEPAVSYFDGWAARTFEGWEGRRTETERIWTGIMGYSADDAPHVGHVPSKPGQYICAGFNGHGMPNVLLSAEGVAEMIKDGRPFSETGVPAIYETSAARLRKIADLVAAPTAGRARADIYLKF
ncbi:FAD dependent oxidoreductase [Daldinia bambusicola]|nr:FAD dependent oxidoreductase [Daldinia bambusicola]